MNRTTSRGARSTKRTYGHGTIEQRGPSVWIVRLSHRRDPATGKRVRESRTVHGTKRTAERGALLVDDRLIFATEIGSMLDRHNVATRFRAGVPPRRLYDLRHSVGTALIAEGNDAKTVSEILGYRDVLTTMVHYVHPRAEDHRRAMQKLPWAAAGS